MDAADIITALTRQTPRTLSTPAWVRQAALIAYPSKWGQTYETTQARYYTEVTVRIPAQKRAKRSGRLYDTLQRRRIDLVALIQANKFKYEPIVVGVEVKVRACFLNRYGVLD